MELEDHYNALWNTSINKFRSGKFEFDKRINSENDTRYGVTLRALPSADIRIRISEMLEEVQEVAPFQYYYPETDLHVTILSIISCHEGFFLKQIDADDYRILVDSAVRSISPLQIRFKGISASASSILVQGFPADNQLNKLRNNLRRKFKQANLQHSIDERYRLKTAHVTAVRFKEPLVEPGPFIKKITRLRNTNFGSCSIDKLELVGNDWYQQKKKVKIIHTFSLA